MRPSSLAWLFPLLGLASGASAAPRPPGALWARENLVAWCIVPFDAKKRGPVERAEMLQRLGLRQLAYDYRAEHVPTFDAEIAAMRARGIAVIAWWFPTTLNATARTIVATFEHHDLRPQWWVTGSDSAASKQLTPAERLRNETERIRAIATEAKRIGCTVGLYNHGGWFGEPENQIAIIERLRRDGLTNVGIVYNFHHGHSHIDRFAELWPKMQPHALAVNINGMIREGDRHGKKIAYLGTGDAELEMMRVIDRSGWHGPIGILNHQTDVDAEEGLRQNLAGLERLVHELRRKAE